MNFLQTMLIAGLLLLALSACDGREDIGGLPVPAAPARQLNAEQQALGQRVFQSHCARCHGAGAEGAPNWHQPDADGHFPAPPLNGSGHAWHHSRERLADMIREGSPNGQGKMPAWKDTLNGPEITAVIAWFQSLWPQPVYEAWYEMQQRGR